MDEHTIKADEENFEKARFIYAVKKAAKHQQEGSRIEFLCPCCGRTAFIAREPDIGDQYAWCECGMKHYLRQTEREQEQRKKRSRSCGMEL